jgi:lactoylglutathione lyase
MRFHVHTHVQNLQASIAFYSKMFDAQPVRVESDYAKWHLENPRLNFAISTRGGDPGVDHLGFQADDPQELAQLKARAEAAGATILDEGATTCCYAKSEKHWIIDPQGVAWEHFQTLGDIPVFSESQKATPSPSAQASACCVPPRGKPVGIPVKAGSACC